MSNYDFTAMRAAMVKSQLRPTDVNDPAIVRAMATVPRERFVPDGLKGVCYNDRLLPLGAGRAMNPPLVTGRMLIEAAPQATDRVLVVAGGTGYAAAILSHLVAEVVMVEDDKALVNAAQANLSDRSNVTVVDAPLTDGPDGTGDFDLLFVDGAVDELPAALIAKLAPGGRVVTGQADGAVTRLAIGRRVGDDVSLYAFAEMEMACLPAFAKKEAFRF